MQAGSLRTRITIERRDTGTDSWGQPVNTWATHAAVWANVRHLSGKEAITGDAPVSTVQASIRIRWRTDLDAGMRCVMAGKRYNIKAVLPDLGSREHVDLVAELVE